MCATSLLRATNLHKPKSAFGDVRRLHHLARGASVRACGAVGGFGGGGVTRALRGGEAILTLCHVVCRLSL